MEEPHRAGGLTRYAEHPGAEPCRLEVFRGHGRYSRRRTWSAGVPDGRDAGAERTLPVAYQSLYRKYRPQRFAELVGQDHVSTALQQRRARRPGRARLPLLRSAGHGQDHHRPAAGQGAELHQSGRRRRSLRRVRELRRHRRRHARSTSSRSTPRRSSRVDEMRDLLERVAYLSAGGAKKVYILDEVHMLSGSAEAALLKTLEEAPEHVVFVLATTDPLKVAPTIRSRTQHFEFTLYTVDELAAHLADVVREGRASTPTPRRSRSSPARAPGSMRDSLSLLDQAIAHGAHRPRAGRRAVRRNARSTVASRSCARSPTRTSPARWSALGEQLDAGHEPRRLTEDLLATVRDTFLLTSARGRVRVDVARRRGRGARGARRAGGRAHARAHARDARAGRRRHARHRRRRSAARPRDRARAPGAPRGGHAAPGPGRTRRPARAWRGRRRHRRPPASTGGGSRVVVRRDAADARTPS